MSSGLTGEPETSPPITWPTAASAPCMFSTSRVRKYDGHTAEQVHVPLRALVGRGLAERHHPGLDRVVGPHPGGVHEPRERGDVDDVACVLLLEHRHEGSGCLGPPRTG